MLLDLFISDSNDLGWYGVIFVPISGLVLLGWLVWLVFTPPKPKQTAPVKTRNWVWALAFLCLVVLGFYTL
jgi:hypothetical protein